MEKVDEKLLEMKKDLHKLVEDHKENTNGRTKQSQLIMQDQRESTVMLDKKLREMVERMENGKETRTVSDTISQVKLRKITNNW